MNEKKDYIEIPEEVKQLQLRSLEILFYLSEVEQLEVLTQYIVDYAQRGNYTHEILQYMQKILKHFRSISDTTQLNYAMVTAHLAHESSELEEKCRLLEELYSLTHNKECLGIIVEFTARLTVELCTIIEYSTPEETLQEKRRYLERIAKLITHPKATAKLVDLYAHALFNQTVDEKELKQKRKYLHRLYMLFMRDLGENNLLVFLAKALVNLAHIETEPRYNRFYMATLQKLSESWRRTTEVEEIYARGLLNALHDTKDDDARIQLLKSFQKLMERAQADSVTLLYAEALYEVSCDTTDVQLRLFCVEHVLQLIKDQKEGQKELYRVASMILFNQSLHEPKIEDKRIWLNELERYSSLSNYDAEVMRQYARELVNLAVEDPDLEKRQEYIETLRKMANQKNTTPGVILEFMKSLLNQALNSKTPNRREVLAEMMMLAEKSNYKNPEVKPHLQAEFNCVYAEGIVLNIGLETEFERQITLLKKIPSLSDFKQSLYFSIFGDILEDVLRTKQINVMIRRQLEAVYQDFKDIQKILNEES